MLKPGDRHYRAYVGPPLEYDLMGALQFNILLEKGLRDSHYLLDVGCGSLRAGRLLIPYLNPGRYFGVEPEGWLIDEGIAKELGQSIYQTKQPTFLRCPFLDNSWQSDQFDFVLMHSILSHCGPKMAVDILREARRLLRPGGSLICTFVEVLESRSIPQGWTYPGVVGYTQEEIAEFFKCAQFSFYRSGFNHPRQKWYVAKKDNID